MAVHAGTRISDVGRTGAAVTRVLGVVVHNWPLKLAAVGLATLLYGGLVLSQSTATLTGVVPVDVREPASRHVPPPVHPARDRDPLLRAGRASGRSRPTFQATVDLADVEPERWSGQPSPSTSNRSTRVSASLGFEPRS